MKTAVLLLASLVILSLSLNASAKDALLPRTTSPNGQYGLTFPKLKAEPGYPPELALNPTLTLVALPGETPVANVPLGNSTLITGMNDYCVAWNKGSTAVLIVEGMKWGADKVVLVNLASGQPQIADITSEIRGMLAPLLAKAGARPFNDSIHFIFDRENRVKYQGTQAISDSGWQFGPNGTVLVDCTCTSDPKQMDPNRFAVRCKGTWNIDAKRFSELCVTGLDGKGETVFH